MYSRFFADERDVFLFFFEKRKIQEGNKEIKKRNKGNMIVPTAHTHQKGDT